MADETYLSGEEHRATHSSSHKPDRKTEIKLHPAMLVGIVIILCVLSFFGGITYQNHNAKAAPASAAGGSGRFGGGFGGRRNGGLGQVTAISTTSITVQNQRTGTDTTYSITSATKITDNGQAAPASDIKTGDTVVVMAGSGSSSTTANSILVNPDFGGGAQPGQGTTQSN